MAAGKTSCVQTQGLRGFTALLTSAACEWFLISLLFIDALLSYLLTKFASYCQLQAPCILCSRLDRVENPELYQTLLCSNHKLEISSLISCHIHDKVADGRGMCDDCLLSSTTNAKAHHKPHRLLVGKFRLLHGDCSFQSSLKMDLFTGSFGSRPCTCCGMLWKPGQSAQSLFKLQSPGSVASNSCLPLPHAPRQSHLNNCHNSKSCGSVTSHCVGQNNCDSSSHVGFTELKLISDSESESQFSDDDNVAWVISENNETGSDPKHQCASVISSKFLLNDSNPAEPDSSCPNPMPSVLDPCVKPNICKQHDVKFLDSDSVNDRSLDEINKQQINQKSSCPDLPKLLSLHEASPLPNVVNISKGESEKSKAHSCFSYNFLSAALSELMTLDGIHSTVGVSPEQPVDVSQASDDGLQLTKNHKDDLMKITTRAGTFKETDLIVNDPAHVSVRYNHLSNTSNFSVTIKEREVSGFVKEQPIEEEVDRVKDKEELKLSSSQYSSPRGSSMSLVIPLDDAYPSETQADASSSSGIKVFRKSVSVDSGLGSMAGSNVSEIEGESIVDQLKKQIAYDKKCISSLYKELEEERNASAVAANEAMAMIMKLQEDRAALHMEALQYLRMMEEQAEHDAAALEKADDLLSEKEKEIQDLEAELEFYRLNLTEEPMIENMHGDNSHLKAENMTIQNVSVPHITNNINTSCNSEITVVSKSSYKTAPFLEFEEETLYISHGLKNLEKKLHQISCNGSSSIMSNGRLEKLEDSKSDGFSDGEELQLNGKEGIDMCVQKKFTWSNGSLTYMDGSVLSDSNDYFLSKEKNHYTFAGPENSPHEREVDLVALENEISELNDRSMRAQNA